jgi:PPOX class probable F420-dependent enzyme
MELDAARNYVRQHHQAVLATLRPDGSPQLTPVTAGIDDFGRLVVSTRETAYKVHNVRRNGRAWLCMLPDGFYGEWIYVEGDASIESLPEAMEGLIAYYRSVSGEHPDWDDYRQAMIRDQRCLIRVDLTRAGPDKHG